MPELPKEMAIEGSAESAHAAPDHSGHPVDTRVLMLGALGVVYGDIGTSPIYAFREALVAASGHEMAPREDVLGVLSLIVWALTIIVTVKYISFVLRADNGGEGGTLSLMALARNSFAGRSAIILFIGILGASMFYGDAVITPAISVLSAVEGLKVVTPTFEPYVVPLTLVILALYLRYSGSVPAGWRSFSGRSRPSGSWRSGHPASTTSSDDPECCMRSTRLRGRHIPHPARRRSPSSPIGAIFLAVTGAEALYADLGHFGRRPIVLAWLCDRVSLPAAQLFRPGCLRAGAWTARSAIRSSR